MSARRAATTSFVGRRNDLAALSERFSSGERVVTLLGPGGIGKTRLARRFAEEHAADFEAEAFADLVDARTVEDASLVAARAIGVHATSDDSSDQLARAVAARGRMLLILDNAESIATGLGDLVGRLVEASRARVLVTSRVALRIAEESVHEVGPLGLARSAAALAESEAATLWADRVRRVRASYSIADDDAAALSELLVRLDGHPLAIELAAMRARSLGTADILKRLEDRFALLRTEGRASDARHAALRSVLESSWEALSPHEHDALAQLTVFAGGFSIEAAEQAIELQDDAPHVLDVIEALRDRSLVTSTAPGRVALYESVAAFASEKIDRASWPRVVARHAAFHAESARALLHRDLRSVADRAALDRSLDELRGNFLAVAERASEGAPIAEQAMLCLAALDVVHPARDPGARFVGLVHEIARRVLDEAPRSVAAGWAGLLRAGALRRAGQYDAAAALLPEAIERAKAHGDRVLESEARATLATIAFLRGDIRAAEEALAALASLDDGAPRAVMGRVRVLSGQLAACDPGRLEQALDHLVRAVSDLEVATPAELAYGLLCLAEVCMDLERLDDAASAVERAGAVQTALGDRRLAALVDNMRGWLALHRGRALEAAAIYRAAIESLAGAAGAETLAAHLEGWHGFACFLAADHRLAATSLARATERVTAADPRAIFTFVACAVRALSGAVTIDDAERECATVAAPTPRTEHLRALVVALLEVEKREGRELAAAVANARALLDRKGSEQRGSIVRFLAGELERAVARRAGGTRRLTVHASGEWFARGDADRVQLGGQTLLKRVLVELVEAHVRERGRGRSIADLFAAGWPGEKASGASVEDRVRALIKRLRRAGIEDLVEAHEGGFRFAADVAIDVRVE